MMALIDAINAGKGVIPESPAGVQNVRTEMR